jgi:hypothetical protein
MDVIKSFTGCVRATEGLLLGGSKVVISSRFAEWKDVVRWCDVTIEENKKAGRFPIYGGIRASTAEPELVRTEDGRLVTNIVVSH